LIVPCGIAERKATSLEKLLERQVHLADVKRVLAEHLGQVFALDMKVSNRQQLLQQLAEAERAVALPA